MTYGVLPTGFARKPLAKILAEIEASLITEFGPDVIQTSQSPLGQINGLMADHIAELWELLEDVYQSYDPDQAEGVRLDMLGRIRLLDRGNFESEEQFRGAITNEGTARVGLADIIRALTNIEGVTYRQVFVNETQETDVNGMGPNTVAIAILGGDDAEIATVINRYVTPGISTYGNVAINTIDEGFCRTVYIIRPFEIGVTLEVQVRTNPDRRGCPAPSPTAIGSALFDYLTSVETRPINGQDINAYLIRKFIESHFDNVEYINVIGLREDNPISYYQVIPFEFFEVARVDSVTMTVLSSEEQEIIIIPDEGGD